MFQKLLSKITSKSGTLKSYITQAEKTGHHQWNMDSLRITIKKSISKLEPITYSYITEARHYGSWAILNEGHYFDIQEEALAAITKQVHEISGLECVSSIQLSDWSNMQNEPIKDYYWDFTTKKWVVAA